MVKMDRHFFKLSSNGLQIINSNNLSKVIVLFTFMLSLGLFSVGCLSSGEFMESKKDLDVILITGTANDEVTWHIKNVRRVNQYIGGQKNITPSLQQGDAISIEGECISKSQNTPFFEGGVGKKTKPKFVLEDLNGNQFELQFDEAKGTQAEIHSETDEFTVVFSLTGDGSINSSINSWADLIIADPDEKSRDLPGHKVSLRDFQP
jgi:hypothetical protein